MSLRLCVYGILWFVVIGSLLGSHKPLHAEPEIDPSEVSVASESYTPLASQTLASQTIMQAHAGAVSASVLSLPWILGAYEKLLRSYPALRRASLSFAALGSYLLSRHLLLHSASDFSKHQDQLSPFAQSLRGDDPRSNPPPQVGFILPKESESYEQEQPQKDGASSNIPPVLHTMMEKVMVQAAKERAGALFFEVMKRHHFFERKPEYYASLGTHVLRRYLHALDLGKVIFLQEDIDHLLATYGAGWMRNMASKKRDFSAFYEINVLRQERVDSALEMLRGMVGTVHDYLVDESTPLHGYEHYSKDLEERSQRLRKIHKFSRLIYNTLYISKKTSQLGEESSLLQFFEHTYHDSHSGATSEMYYLDVLKQSFFSIFDRFSSLLGTAFVLDEQHPSSGVVFPLAEDSLVSLDPSDGFVKIGRVEGNIRHDYVFKVGDRVLGMIFRDSQGDIINFLPLFPFVDYFKLSGLSSFFASYKKNRPSSKLDKISFSILRKAVGSNSKEYHIVEVAVNLPPKEKHHHSPAVNGEENILSHPLFSLKKVVLQGRDSGIGIVKIPSFSPPKGVSMEDMQALSLEYWQHMKQLKTHYNIDSVILDLRGNEGGYAMYSSFFMTPFVRLRDLREVGSEFLYPRHLAYPLFPSLSLRSQHFRMQRLKYKFVFQGPLVVLVDRDTASLAEMWAQEIRSSGRGVIVGEGRTVGKGVFTYTYALDAKNQLQLTDDQSLDAVQLVTSRVYLHNGERLDENGIVPDVVVPSLNDAYAKDRSRAVEDNAGVFFQVEPSFVMPASSELYFTDYRREDMLVELFAKLRNDLGQSPYARIQEYAREYKRFPSVSELPLKPSKIVYYPHINQGLSSDPTGEYPEGYEDIQGRDLTLEYALKVMSMYSEALAQRSKHFP